MFFNPNISNWLFYYFVYFYISLFLVNFNIFSFGIPFEIEFLNDHFWILRHEVFINVQLVKSEYLCREKMAQAYDFALEKIGMDIHSYSIWNDYVNFLKSVEAVGSYAENQKISAVRKVYQRGVINPMIGMETFWKDYISFEQVQKISKVY